MPFAIVTAAMASTALATLRSMTDKVMDFTGDKAKEFIADKAMDFTVDKTTAMVVKIGSDIAELQETLGMIQGIVQEAEKKEIDNDYIQNWLRDLVDVSLEARDVLDNFIVYCSCVRVEPSSRLVNFIPSRISFLLSYFGGSSSDASKLPFAILNRLEKNIRSVRERFDKKKKDGKTFATLKSTFGGGGSESVPTNNTRPEVGPYLNRQKKNLFLGRDEVKKGIMDKLLHLSDDLVHVVSIWGIGGIGKTTLALSIYNDERLQEQDYPSKNRLWYSVGENKFSAKEVIKEIVSDSNTSGIGSLQKKLVEKLKEGRFLIVLDDVWNIDRSEWRKLWDPLTNVGTSGVIIVTTRKSEVITATNTLEKDIVCLRPLSYQDSWSIFESRAFISGKSDSRPDLKCVGEKIVEKLKGLPLALEVVGCSLLNEDVSAWENFLNSKNDDVMSALRWSYKLLSPHLKYCFAYCALFPKDHEFEEKVLVEMWMAHDIIQNAGETPEDVGARYFKQLVNASLLQFVDGKYVMHDMVHDLALLVSNGEFASTSNSHSNDQIGKVRHINITEGDFAENLRLCKSKRILTLYTMPRMLWEAYNRTYITIDRVLVDVFNQMKSIRVLVLSRKEITKIPDCIGELGHLRYFDVMQTSVKSLPDSLCHLYHLQVLAAPLDAILPKDIVNLVNLRYMRANLSTCKGVGKLKFLQELTSICVREDDNIRELGDIQGLRGKLTIKGLENVTSSEDAVGSSMEKKTHIDQLILLFSKKISDMEADRINENLDLKTNTTISEEVLNSLKCPLNLTSLKIDGYNGLKPPIWMVDGKYKFDKLQTLNLSHCSKLDSLPPLGELNFLKVLDLLYLHGVKRLGDEFYGNLTKRNVFFPSLESLSFFDMQKWTGWDDITIENSNMSFFPRLTSLGIYNCPKLVLLLPNVKTLKQKDKHPTMSAANFMESLSCLRIWTCHGLKRLQLHAFVSLKDLLVVDCNSLLQITSATACSSEKFKLEKLLNISCEHLETMDVGSLPSIECFTIESCDKLISVPRLPSIKDLRLHECESLKALTFNIIDGLDSLEELDIYKCPVLELAFEEGSISSSYSSGKSVAVRLCISTCKKQIFTKLFEHKFVSLETLIIANVTEFENFSETEENNFCELKSLKFLHILDFSDLQSLPANIHKLSSLNTLKIERCWKLQSLPRDFYKLSSLESLYIDYCSKFQSLPPNFHELSSLNRLHIGRCRQLQSLPENFHKLSSLEKLHIYDCPQLRSLPALGLPRSIESLKIYHCPPLCKRCKRESDLDWHKIKHIHEIRLSLKDNNIRYKDGVEVSFDSDQDDDDFANEFDDNR